MSYSEKFNEACDLGNLIRGHKGLDTLDVESLMGSALIVEVSTSSKEVAKVALYINSKEDVHRIKNLVHGLGASVEETLEYKKRSLEAQLRDIDRILIGGEGDDSQYRAEKGMNR